MEKENIKDFNGIYPVSKTLRFELKPIGLTMENLNNNGIITEDAKRAESYKIAKTMIDNYHRYFISNKLKTFYINWTELKDVINEFNRDSSSDNKKRLITTQDKYRKIISDLFTKDADYKKIFGKELFTELLQKDLNINKEIDKETQVEVINYFNRFTTYFTGFHENRKNVYSKEEISTSIGFRVVHDNFPKFLANINAFNRIKSKAPDIIKVLNEELEEYLNGESIEDIFGLNYFNNVISQEGIDFYNMIIGGVSTENLKTKGLNELTNQYVQQNKECGLKKNDVKMITLYKQILSEKTSYSFNIDIIEKDSEVYELIDLYMSDLKREDVINKMKTILCELDQLSLDNIYINGKYLSNVSYKIFNNWSKLKEGLNEYAIANGLNKKQTESLIKKDSYSLSELNESIEALGDKHSLDFNILEYFNDGNDIIDEIFYKYEKLQNNINGNSIIRGNKENVAILKDFADSLINLYHFWKPFKIQLALEKDVVFYSDFEKIIMNLESFVIAYNKIRNYITKKNYSKEKIKLNFTNPTLLNGWDQNKEQANTSIILIKDDKYYLGILNAKNKPKFDSLIKNCDTSKTCYYKMKYKYLAGPNKMLPHVFLSKSGIDKFDPSEYILEGYNAKKHIKGEGFDLKFCHDLIDFYKNSIAIHPDWKEFNFDFSDTESYENISDFYREISEQGYKLSKQPIESESIEELVNKNQLYLFQVYNKDFAKGATGKPNLHTMYWKALFDDKNLKDVVFKLNGEAEVFYRRKSIDDPFSHKVGEMKVNKRLLNGDPIPGDVYKELCLYYNSNKNDTLNLSDDTNEIIKHEKVGTSVVKHEIIKDRRFTEDKFFFHVPITINYKRANVSKFNEQVINFIKNNEDIKIIGLDRGERHLLYLTMINLNGDIIRQKSFNIVNKMDYHEKLDQREKERDVARKSWDTIDAIKDLKEGYLSQIIHELAIMMIENNAILAIEDLNFGFKRGRYKVEKQVYQKFEKMLIDKLNYLVDKNLDIEEDGGVLKGLQLTQPFISFNKLGKQTGFLFYVPAAYTSKIDPTTGFANIFDMRKITNMFDRLDFISKFDYIKYNESEDCFVFGFDYSNFDTFQTFTKTSWDIYSFGKRIYTHKQDNNFISKDIFPTDIIKKALNEANINYIDESNLIDSINELKDEQLLNKLSSDIIFALKLILQIRNNNATTKEDFIISCVKNQKDEIFDSRVAADNLPKDADANGAYHISLKGKMLVDRVKNGVDTREALKITNANWFEFLQKDC